MIARNYKVKMLQPKSYRKFLSKLAIVLSEGLHDSSIKTELTKPNVSYFNSLYQKDEILVLLSGI